MNGASLRLRLLAGAGTAFCAAWLVRMPLAAGIEARLTPLVAQAAQLSGAVVPPARPGDDRPPPAPPNVVESPATPSNEAAGSEAPSVGIGTTARPRVAPSGQTTRVAARARPVTEGSRPGRLTVTSDQLAEAMKHGVPGASVSLARDDRGRPAGLVLHGVSRLARYGVRDGDVLVSANGLPLRTGDEALRALGSVSQANTVVVKLLRGGTPIVVTVDLVP